MNTVSNALVQILTTHIPIISTADIEPFLVRFGLQASLLKSSVRLLSRRGMVVTATVNMPAISGRRLMVDSEHAGMAEAIARLTRPAKEQSCQPTTVVCASTTMMGLCGRAPIILRNQELVYRYLRLGKLFTQVADSSSVTAWRTVWPQFKMDAVIARILHEQTSTCYVVAPPAMSVEEAQAWLTEIGSKEDRYVVC